MMRLFVLQMGEHTGRIQRSLDDNSVATVVHAFAVSRVDYCGSLMIGAPRKTTDKLQRVLNSAARIDQGLTHFFCVNKLFFE